MPYVLRDGNNYITTVMINPIDVNTEFVADNNDDLQYFYLKPQKYKDNQAECNSRNKSAVVNAVTYALEGSMYYNMSSVTVKGIAESSANVNIPDINGVLQLLTIANATSLLDSLELYLNDLQDNYTTHIDAIVAATTLAALQAVDTAAGWPVAPS